MKGDARGPKTRGHVHLDLVHRTHVLNLWDNPGGASEVFTPFLRVTNSFTGARALRFDFGYMREHCSNGVVFEEKVASLAAAHTRRDLGRLQVEVATVRFEGVATRFAEMVKGIRAIKVEEDESMEAVRLLLCVPRHLPGEPLWRDKEVEDLERELARRHAAYRDELGANAYALFNTLTDVAARPPASRVFRRDRATIERRAGAWLKELAVAGREQDFGFGTHLAGLRSAPQEGRGVRAA